MWLWSYISQNCSCHRIAPPWACFSPSPASWLEWYPSTHVRQWAEGTVRLLDRAYQDCVAQGVALIPTTSSAGRVLCQAGVPLASGDTHTPSLASGQLLVSRPTLNSKPHMHWLHSYHWLALFWLGIPDSPKTSQQQKKRGSKQLVTNIFRSSNQGSGRILFCLPILFYFPSLYSEHLTSHSLTPKVHTYHKINFQCWAFGATLTFWILLLPLDRFPCRWIECQSLGLPLTRTHRTFFSSFLHPLASRY